MEHISTDLEHISSDLDHIYTDMEHISTDLEHISSDLDHISTDLEHISTDLEHIYTDLEHIYSIHIDDGSDKPPYTYPSRRRRDGFPGSSPYSGHTPELLHTPGEKVLTIQVVMCIQLPRIIAYTFFSGSNIV